MVSINVTGNNIISILISDEVPRCLVPALQEVAENTTNTFYGQLISSHSLDELQHAVAWSTDTFLLNHSHRDGYPILIKLLAKLKVINANS